MRKYLFVLIFLHTFVNFIFTENSINIELIRIKAGQFIQGDTVLESNLGRGLKDELPSHYVTITNSYYLSKYEVSNELFCRVMNWALEKKYIKISKSLFNNEYIFLKNINTKDIICAINIKRYVKPIDIYIDQKKIYPVKGRENHPVINVTWNGVIAFCNYLSEIDNLDPVYDLTTKKCNWNKNGYRLPTESEWEFAAKGGIESKNFKYSGSNNPEEIGHFFLNNDSLRDTVPVDSLKPNELGLFHMSGNVKEWCWDWFSLYTDEEEIDPKGPLEGEKKVVKGGSWNFPQFSLNPSSRYDESPAEFDFDIGFRVAKNE